MSTTLEHARDLKARGLSPIPVPHKEKGPRIKGWQTLRLASDDLPQFFNSAPANIGTLLGESVGWIVDVDLDHAHAVRLADSFLPATGMVWGRDGKPRSHRLYRLTRPADTRKWASKTDGMIVELRSTGCQTIAPGSTHPSGEPVRWDDDGEPATIDPDDLITALEALVGAVRAELGEGTDTMGGLAPHPVSPALSGASNYGRESLRREAATVAAAQEGARNDALNRAAFNVGTLIGGGEVDRPDAESELLASARSCGLSDAEARRTIASGIASGMEHPRQRPVQAITVTTTHRENTGVVVPVTVTPEPVPAFTPFPVDVLPEPIRGFLTEAAKAIWCDASYIAMPMLAALASAIGTTRRLALKRGWTEPAILWTVTVGESGTMKTPAFKLAMKAIRKTQADAFKEHEAARADWERQQLLYETELQAWKHKAAKGRADSSDPPEKPTAPTARRYIVSDTTTEALAPILLANPRGVLLARDELSGWLGSFDRYAKTGRGGADSAHWLSMHNGEALVIDRKTGTQTTIYVPSASVCIAGGIQPGILARSMGQEHHESGMLARLLFAMPPRSKKQWTEADVRPLTEAKVAAVFDRLFQLQPENDADGYERPRIVTLDDDAKLAWVRFYDEHATEQVDLSGDMSAAWSKLEGYAARLALVVHLVRCAADDSTLRDPERVDEASMAAGIVLSRWFGNEARRVYAILSESDEGRKSRRLVEWIERRGGTVTVRELTHGVRAYRDNPDAAECVLSSLAKAGVGYWETHTHGAKGGRPAQRFRLGSAATVTETPADAGEIVGSGDGDTGDTSTDTGAGWGEL